MRNPECRDCDLYRSSRNVCVWGHGEGPGFVIGEAPGESEARTGKPFMGSSGQLLRELLAKHGIEAYITNTVKCRPPKNRKPEPSEIATCRHYLAEELEERDPKAVLLLGATAMRAMIGRTKITEMNGQIVEKDGRQYVCAFHPSYILRDPSKESALAMAIARYAEVLGGKFSQKLPEWKVIDRETIEKFIEQWLTCKSFTYDLETTGLEWWKDGEEINCCSFTLDRVNNWVLPIAKARVIADEYVAELFKWLVKTSAGKHASGQNAKFDNLWLMKKYGVRFHLDFDTMLAHYTIDENSAHGLKLLARQYCGAPDYDLTLKEKQGAATWPKIFAYAAADSFYTDQLVDIFDRKMDQDDQWIFHNLTMPCARIFEEIEFNGLYVDLPLMSKVEKEQNRLLIQTEKELNKIAKRTVNWNAPSDVARVLYGEMGLTPTIYTAKGAPSTAEGALVDIDHPITKLIEKYRQHQKFLSTYIVGWKQFMDGPHLYMGFKLHGTVTGRFSSRLHQVPRDGTIRNLIIAPPGWTFVQLDLSQAELRIIAIVSGDPEMLACFRDGRDIHWRTLMGAIFSGGGEYVQAVYDTAKKISGEADLSFTEAIELVEKLGPDKSIEIWKGWKEARKKAKGINFGFSYGQSAEGFITYAKNTYGFEPTLEESSAFRGGFFNTYRRLPEWHERQKILVRDQGLVRNLIGRKRRLPGINSPDKSVRAECERQAINSPIQGFIGDYKAMIIVELRESFDWNDLRIVGEVHDSVLMWIRTDRVQKLLPEVKYRTEHPRLAKEAGLDFPIPLTVDIEIGPWGAGKPWRN